MLDAVQRFSDDELVEQSPWIRRLARGLLDDDDEIDDVVQDALVAAHDLPGSVRDRRSWLAGVVHNLCRRRHRDAGRRPTARFDDEDAWGGESEPAEMLHFETTRRRVVHAVLELAEPYKSIVLLRFYEVCTPSEIARRTGTPVATVSTRLHRALKTVRERLEARYGDAIRLELCILAGIRPESLGRPAPAGPGAGDAARSPAGFWQVAAAAAGVILVGAWLAPLGEGPATAAPVRPRAMVESSFDRAPNPAGIDARSSARLAVRPATESSATLGTPRPEPGRGGRAPALSGRVLEGIPRLGAESGRAGIEVGVQVRAGQDRQGELLASFRLVSDEHGRFEVDLDLGDDRIVTVVCRPEPGAYYAAEDAVTVLTGEPPLRPLEPRIYPHDARLAIAVVDDAGEPLEGAEVQAFGAPRGTSDRFGRLELPLSSLASPVQVSVLAPGHARLAQAFTVLAGQQLSTTLRMKAGALASGWVVGPEGLPVEGALVHDLRLESLATRTERDGSFRLGDLDASSPFVRIHAAGFVDEVMRLERGQDGRLAETTVWLERGARVAGRVLSEGRPVAGAVVEPESGSPSAVTAADGRFVLTPIPSGSCTLVVEKPGLGAAVRKIEIPPGVASWPDQELDLDAGLTIRGRLVDGEGGGIVGRAVVAHRGVVLDAKHVSDPDGSFNLAGLPPGDTTVEFHSDGREPRKLGLQEMLVLGPLDVTLFRSGRVGGRVVDRWTDEPIESFRVRITDVDVHSEGEDAGFDRTWAREGYAFAHGRWTNLGFYSPLRAGATLRVEVSAPGYEPCVADVPVGSGFALPDFVHRLTREETSSLAPR